MLPRAFPLPTKQICRDVDFPFFSRYHSCAPVSVTLPLDAQFSYPSRDTVVLLLFFARFAGIAWFVLGKNLEARKFYLKLVGCCCCPERLAVSPDFPRRRCKESYPGCVFFFKQCVPFLSLHGLPSPPSFIPRLSDFFLCCLFPCVFLGLKLVPRSSFLEQPAVFFFLLCTFLVTKTRGIFHPPFEDSVCKGF